jgi:cytidylate kinase
MKRVITISREFGSGGRSIAKEVAEKLGYAYYDKALIDTVAEATGLNRKYIEKNAEYSSGRNIFSYAFIGRGINGMSVSDYLYQKQRELILYIAEKGNCVIVGRCADYILRDRTDCLNVFIHADEASKVDRIVNKYGETDKRPEKRLYEKDRARKVNYQYYTDRDWGKAQNYDMTLCSSSIGLDTCVDLIVALAQKED